MPGGKYELDLDKSPRDRATARAIFRAAKATPGVAELVVLASGDKPQVLFRESEVDEKNEHELKRWVDSGTGTAWA